MKLRRLVSISLTLTVGLSIVVGFNQAVAAGNPNCNAVDGDYIVSFVRGVNVDKEIQGAPGRAISAKYRYQAVLNGFAATLSAEQVCAFQKRPSIEIIELDKVASINTIQTPAPSWGLDRIDDAKLANDKNYDYLSDGTGVTAYVIDTGIETTHPDFEGRARWGGNWAGGANTDCNGHGTHVAGTIGGKVYGVAKKVNLVAIKVLSCSGSGSYSGVIAGMDYVAKTAAKPAVANMSLGGPGDAAMDTAVNGLVAAGVFLVVAAGNESTDASTSSPARSSSAITVGASDATDLMASFSNYGPIVDVFAPGVSIKSDWIKGRTNTISGTSMASPHVAGVIARYLQKNPFAVAGGTLPSILLNTNIVRLRTLALSNTTQSLVFADPKL